MSVGHVARVIEAAGIPTVIIAVRAFQERVASMAVPRLLVTPYPMGRPLGAPGDDAGHRAVVQAALDLLEKAEQGGTVEAFPGRYRPVAR